MSEFDRAMKQLFGQVRDIQRQAESKRAETLRERREALGFCGPDWDSLVSMWRTMKNHRLVTLWEYAGLASSVADRFGEDALRHFALQIGHPERCLLRGAESYRASHVEPAVGVFMNEAEYAEDLRTRLLARGWQVKREAVMGFGRADALISVSEGGRRRHIQVIEAKLSADWRSAAQALGQLLFYRGALAGARDVPDYGLWFACPVRPEQRVLDVLKRQGVGYIA